MFPLLVDSTGFFKILECKYRYFILISSTYIVLIIIALFYYFIFKKQELKKYFKISKVQIAILIFLIINILSCLFSPYFNKYNLFVGIGRGEGLITVSLYCLTFFIVSIFGKFHRRYIVYFAISSILLNFICVLQYIGFNPFNMYQDGIGTHNVSFIGTIGNVDFVSAMYTILLTISVAAFIFLDDSKYFKIIYLISIYLGFFIFEVLDVLSGTVGFILTLTIVLPFIVTNSKRLYRLLIIVATVLLGYVTNIIINPVYHYSINKLILEFQFNTFAFTLLVIIAILFLLAFILKRNVIYEVHNKKIIKYMYLCIIFCVAISLIVIYFVNINFGIIHEIHEILHGNLNDEFGTYRMFLWKRACVAFFEYPIIGTGPDTFTARFMDKYTQDIINIGELTINDTAANVYLTMLVNIGILGLLSYIGFISLLIYNSIKNKNKYSNVLLIAIICFLIQDFFNLWTVMVTPIFFVLMALNYISTKYDKKEIVYDEK